MLAFIPRSLIFAALRDHPGRTLLSVAGIALGVALATAIHTINGSAISEMSQAMRIISGNADLRVEAGRSGFDENLFTRIALHPDVAAASPILTLEVMPAGQTRWLHVMGIDALRAVYVQPQLVAQSGNAQDLDMLRPDRIFLNDAALEQFNIKVGEVLGLNSVSGLTPVKVAGRIEAGETGVALGVMDIAAVQTLAAREGWLTRIDVRVRPGIALDAAQRNLGALLPPGVHVTTPAQNVERSTDISRAYRVNLTVLALVALFTGAFLVFSSSALSVVRRRAELALWRVLGVTRRELALALTLEGLLVGAVGSLLGCVSGVLFAQGVLNHFGGDLGSGFFSGVRPSLSWNVTALMGFFLLGSVTGMLGTVIPALEAARRAPAMALKAGDDQAAFERLPPAWLGLALMTAGGLLTLLPPIGNLPWPGYSAIGLLLIGALVLMPRLTRSVLTHLPAPRSPNLLLAWQQVRGMPGYAATGMMAVVTSFSLVIAMAVMVGSFRQSLDLWLRGVLHADLYVRADQSLGAASTLSLEAQRVLLQTPGVKQVDFVRYQSMLLHPDKHSVTLIARPVRSDVLHALNIRQRTEQKAPATQPTVWISEAVADLYGMRPGDTMALPIFGKPSNGKTNGKTLSVFIGGVWRDYARSYGAVVMDSSDYQRVSGDYAINDAALWLSINNADSKHAVRDHIRNQMVDGAKLEVADPDEIHKFSMKIFDRSFAVTYALELAALLVGLAGISSHFAALAYARRREFGVLRHLGLRKRDIGVMLAAEGALIGALGALVGLVLGFVVSLILIYVVNRQSFHWSMELHPPWAWMAALAGVLILLASAAALASGRVAMNRAAVLAVKEDA